jgi:hypothetical protein
LSNFLSYWEEISTKGVWDRLVIMTVISIIIKPIKIFISIFFAYFCFYYNPGCFSYVIRSQNLFVIPSSFSLSGDYSKFCNKIFNTILILG